MNGLANFRQVWAVDFEFTAPPGGLPKPICVVARELKTDRLERVWLETDPPAAPPYEVGPDALFIAYYSSAEFGCRASGGVGGRGGCQTKSHLTHCPQLLSICHL